jgi:hypothetical protein
VESTSTKNIWVLRFLEGKKKSKDKSKEIHLIVTKFIIVKILKKISKEHLQSSKKEISPYC